MNNYNQQIISYREAADELGRKLIKLYDLRMFPRQGKNFADQLFESGMEAGAYLSTIADVEDRAVKRDAAVKAYDLLVRTEYILSVMKNAKFYAQSDVFEIEEYLGSLIKAVREVIIVTCSQMETKPAPQPVPVPAPAPAPAPAPRPAPQPQIITAPAPAPQQQSPQVIIMRDGVRPQPQPVVQPVVQPIYQMPPQPKPQKQRPAPRAVPAPAPKPREVDPWDDDPDGFNSPADY